MFKGVLALTATAAISLAVFANSASAEDLTKFYSTERVSGYKSGEFMILAEDDVNFRSNPAHNQLPAAPFAAAHYKRRAALG